MSATPTTPQLEGSESPNQIEFLWLRYRSLIWTLIAAVGCALLINVGYKYFHQKDVDETWSGFSASMGLDDSYADIEKFTDSLAKNLGSVELSQL